MALGREERKLIERGIQALERNAEASEKLLGIAEKEQFEFEHGPTICPGCGKLNPQVTILAPEPGQEGLVDEFVIQFESHCCNRVLYGIPVAWNLVDDIDIATDIVNRKKGGQ